MARTLNPPSYEGVDPRTAGSTWTGGQYSLVRALFGTWMLAGFARLPWWEPSLFVRGTFAQRMEVPALLRLVPNFFAWVREPWLPQAVVAIGALASLLFAIGAWHRVAAALLAYLWCCIATAFPSLPTPGGAWIVVLLLAHLTLPPAPYGSWVARGRADPDGGWRMHLPVFQLGWALLLLGSLLGVYDKVSAHVWSDGSGGRRALLTIGLICEATLPLAVFKPRGRALSWSALLAWRIVALACGVADERLRGLLVAHLYAFDPLWLPALRAKAREHLFFDGTCGLCHRFVRFVAAEDRGSAFFYSPLQGEAIQTLVPEAERAALPDSVAVLADDGRLLSRSDAVIHVSRRLGGAWRALANALAALPKPLRDLGYDLVARVRLTLFRRPSESCPMLSPRLRTYFLP